MSFVYKILFAVVVGLIGCIAIIVHIQRKYKDPSTTLKYVLGAVATLFVICHIPMPVTYWYPDHNAEIAKDHELLVAGVWCNVYRHKDPTKVIKVISAPGISHKDFTHASLPTLCKTCTRNWCTLPVMLTHLLATNYMMVSMHRIMELDDVPYFAKIYDIDDEKGIVIQEYVPNDVSTNCPADFEYQLQDFNRILGEKGYIIDDIHQKNMMVDDAGVIKVIDSEVYTDGELGLQRLLVGIIDGNWNEKPKSYNNADRILCWTDGRKSAEDVCYGK